MLVDVGIELLNDIFVVKLKVLVRTESHSEQDQVLGTSDAVHVLLNLCQNGLIEKFVANSNLLALVKHLHKVLHASIFECLLKGSNLVFAR